MTLTDTARKSNAPAQLSAAAALYALPSDAREDVSFVCGARLREYTRTKDRIAPAKPLDLNPATWRRIFGSRAECTMWEWILSGTLKGSVGERLWLDKFLLRDCVIDYRKVSKLTSTYLDMRLFNLANNGCNRWLMIFYKWIVDSIGIQI